MKLSNLIKLFVHRQDVRRLLEAYLERETSSVEFGGLTHEEIDGLIKWINGIFYNHTNLTVVEIGTLFGITARELALHTPAKIVTIDNFSWNPFGLDAETHERFTRSILKTSNVQVVSADSVEYLNNATDIGAVFLDGDHRYEVVKQELIILRERGVRYLSGHDWGNEYFGVTRAVKEVLGEPDYVVGRCWFK